MKNLSLALLCFPLLFAGCFATLKPGADAVVVRAQQAEQMAFATFDTYLKMVHAHEAKVKSTAPAAYDFAEWLRAKQPDGQPRGLAMIESLGRVRRAYAANRTTEGKSSLLSALSALQSSIAETQKHLAAVQPQPR